MSILTKVLTSVAIIPAMLIPLISGGTASAVSSAAPTVTPIALVSVPLLTTLDAEDAGTADALGLAKTYVALSGDAWKARVESATLKAEAARAQVKYDAALVEYDNDVLEANRLQAEADVIIKDVTAWVKGLSRSETANISPTLTAVLDSPENSTNFAHDLAMMDHVSEVKNRQANAANEAQIKAVAAKRKAEKTLVEANDFKITSEQELGLAETAKIEADTLLISSKKALTDASTALNKSELDAGIANSIPASDRILSVAMVEYWNAYLTDLNNKQIVPPEVETIINPFSSAPTGFTGLLSTDGNEQRGVVATIDGTIVPSRQSIERVSNALANLGKPYAPESSKTPESTSCQAFVSQAYGKAEVLDLSTLYTSAWQTPQVEDATPGDIIFFADPISGIHQAGINVGNGLVVSASASSRSVSIEPIGMDSLRATRPNVNYIEILGTPAPVKMAGGIDWNCGGIDYTAVAGADQLQKWTLPFPDGTYSLGAKFDAEDVRFSDFSGKSPGLEFVSTNPSGIVQAATAGMATVSEDEIWGKSVTITYNETLSIKYSGLSTVAVANGAQVLAGAPLGVAGNTGRVMAGTTATGTFVAIYAGVELVNPEVLFFPAQSTSMGGYQNGQIPASALCPIGNGQMLQCDAARSFAVFNAAYKANFGVDIAITDSYRSLEGQITCRANKGNMCATPGTSNHGWGLALDLGGGIQTFSTPEYLWMMANGSTFGWSNPEWAVASGSKPEPWHWEYLTVYK